MLIDPDAVGADQGTLISIADIRTVAQEMIQSMNESRQLASVRASGPLRIALGTFKQRTSIAIFDKEIFLNRLLGSLNEADTEGSYVFVRRNDLEPREAAGATADFVMTGELREILQREPVSGGGEVERRTVQYSLAITRVNDAAILWTKSHEIVKSQVTGAVYR